MCKVRVVKIDTLEVVQRMSETGTLRNKISSVKIVTKLSPRIVSLLLKFMNRVTTVTDSKEYLLRLLLLLLIQP